MKKPKPASRQPELFPRSMLPTIPIEPNHRLVLLTDRIDWTELLEFVENIRLSVVKNAAGRPPQLRALTGALLLKATRDMTWREAADLIRHYAPARYLCGLTETDWSPDHRTLHDFAVLLGEEGLRLINEFTVKWAVAEMLADPSVAVGDTTAQEAAIPYPNEMGLMAAFVTSALAASKHAGVVFKKFATTVTAQVKEAREKVREYRLFAKGQGEGGEEQDGGGDGERHRAHQRPARAGGAGGRRDDEPGDKARHRGAREARAAATDDEQAGAANPLLAEDRLRRGRKDHQPARSRADSIVRGKVGKKVEFGLSWGFTRLGGGFLLARLATNRNELVDSKLAVEAVRDHIRSLRGGAPRVCLRPRATATRMLPPSRSSESASWSKNERW